MQRPATALAAVTAALAAFALGASPAPAQGPAEPTLRLADGREVVADEVVVRLRGEPAERAVPLEPGQTLPEALNELRADPDVRWAAPNAIAYASGVPRDPGRSGVRGGWQDDQWNFLEPPAVGALCSGSRPCGVNAPRAWRLLRKSGHPAGRRADGRRGPTVAILDTGVAYRNRGSRFRRSPDIAPDAFSKGRDFVGMDRFALDQNGHGTHVASTIFEQTDNRRAVTGLANGLRLMPVRVLNGAGSGSATTVARGIRWATRNGADVINLSLEFGPGFAGCAGLRGVCHAIRSAQRAGIVVVAATGNAGAATAQMPGAISLGVASGTIRGCLSDFSSRGPGTDITAPGGGPDAEQRVGGSQCRPFAPGPGVVQLTLKSGAAGIGDYTRFGYPRYEGTSMSAPHVSATAGLVLASKVLKRKLDRRPSPAEIETWIGCAARPVGDTGKAELYGAGLLDTAAALDPRTRCRELKI